MLGWVTERIAAWVVSQEPAGGGPPRSPFTRADAREWESRIERQREKAAERRKLIEAGPSAWAGEPTINRRALYTAYLDYCRDAGLIPEPLTPFPIP